MYKKKLFKTTNDELLNSDIKDKIINEIIFQYNDLDDDLEAFGCEVENILAKYIHFKYE